MRSKDTEDSNHGNRTDLCRSPFLNARFRSIISSAVSIELEDAFLPLEAPKSRGIMLSIRAENSLLSRSKLSKSVVDAAIIKTIVC
jgi:hypothetical protein